MLDKKLVIDVLQKAARCWAGYEPVPGAKAYSDGSCRPKGSKKTKKEVIQGKNHSEKKAGGPGTGSFTLGSHQIPSQQPRRTAAKTTPKQREAALNALSQHPLYKNNTKIWDDDTALQGAVRHILTMPNPSSQAGNIKQQLTAGGWNMQSFPAAPAAPVAQRPVPKQAPVQQQAAAPRTSPCGPNGCPPRPPVSRTPMGVPRLNTPKMQPGQPNTPRPTMNQMSKPPQTTQMPAPFPKVAAGPIGRGPSASTLLEQSRQRSLKPLQFPSPPTSPAPAGGQSVTARMEQTRQRSLTPMRPAPAAGGQSLASQAEQARQMGLARTPPPDDGVTGVSPPIEFDTPAPSDLGQVTPPPLPRANLPLQPMQEPDTHVPMPSPPSDLVQTPR